MEKRMATICTDLGEEMSRRYEEEFRSMTYVELTDIKALLLTTMMDKTFEAGRDASRRDKPYGTDWKYEAPVVSTN